MILNRDIDKDIRGNIILDSINSKLILSPTKEEIEKAKDMQKQLNLASKKSFESRFDIVKTSFGKNIKILANVTDLDSAREAKEFGADGIGLLRTEFLFKTKRPTLQEEIETYKEIFELFDDITIRTLDIGGDKSLPYISIPKEDNPFLGLRGIRFSLYEKELFRQQLLAIFKAHNNRPIKIMFPMVSQKEEFIEAKEIAQEVARENSIDISNIMFGIMLEVPSVILAIKIFDREVDFYSVGTNDLTQYLFAIERTHNTLKVDPLSPILISALKIIIDTAKKPVSICGELAGIDEAVKILVKIGYDRLSVSPRLVPHIKNVVRSFNF
jgi:phosphocarrier protein FPr